MKHQSLELNREYIELNSLLKLQQVAQSGGHANLIIDEGQVKVNGQIEKRRRCKLRPGDRVEVNGQTIEIK
ncbi:MAG TPA: RNA-binding S4 domain-containing protein [Luteibaculaceae bacterium]|nr:RNA-binding S4 domain-containing protein [Luteibaculaceae bacterium]